MVRECPVCTQDHPTGTFTQTFGDLIHHSRECAHVASNAGVVTLAHLADPVTLGMLQAGKRHFEQVGVPTQCTRCGFYGPAEDDCPACGKWLV